MINEIKYCGYSNCFREAVKMRGFLPVCDFHLHNPQKWGKDGVTFTGSVFKKKDGGEGQESRVR